MGVAWETGQFLLRLDRHRAQLELVGHWMRRDATKRLSVGDNDLMLFAWLALQAPFHLVAANVTYAGYRLKGTFCGHTELQHHPTRPEKVVFAHRTRLKMSHSPRFLNPHFARAGTPR